MKKNNSIDFTQCQRRFCARINEIAAPAPRTFMQSALPLEAASVRKMEPATLSGVETANILKFLISISHPTPEIIASIESGLGWFERAKVTGLTRARRDGRTVYDADPDSTEVYWAGFYSLTTSQPVFPGRDGVLYDSFEVMAENNRLGYDFYSTRPGSMVNNGQKKWRKKLAGQTER